MHSSEWTGNKNNVARQKVNIGRRYQENLVFDIPVQHKIFVLEFFFGTIFLRCIIFKRLPEVHRARQKITSICYQVRLISFKNFKGF